MPRPPTRRHPQRTYRWEGVVEEVLADSFWARLVPLDHQGPDLGAEFDLDRIEDPRPGRLFNLYAHRRGRKTRIVMRSRLLRWSAEEVDRFTRLAAELSALVG